MTTLVMISIILFGLMAYFQLPISNLPDVNYPTIQVTATLPGASPETMANTVASPLEKQFMTIPGVKEVTSTSTLGNTTVILQFQINKNIDAAAQDVQAAISQSKAKLPPNLPNDPTYKKVNPSDSPILYIALISKTMPLGDLYNYGYSYIGQRLSMLDGVAQVLVYGSPFAVRIQVDPGALAARSISLTDVGTATALASPVLPTGQLDGKTLSSLIITQGQLLNAAQYNPMIIAYRDQAPVRVQDVGKAVDSLQNDRQRLIYVDQGRIEAGVILAIQRQPGANTVAVADAIHQYLPELLNELPASVDMQVVFDRSDSIRDSIAEVKQTLLIAFVLVVLVIFFYFGKITDTIIPSLAMPLSVIGTFIFMYFLGFSLDNLSLLGLTLAIGFIIDDAIVVQENIVRHVEEGAKPWRAALDGSAQISFTVVSMTLSLIAIFIPMLFMGGLIGKIFQEFSITLAIVTFLSGVVALTLTPMLCSRFVVPRKVHDSGVFARFRVNDFMLRHYKPSLLWVIRNRGLAFGVAILSIIGSVVLFKMLPTDFIPDEDIGFIIGYTEAEQGTSSGRMQDYQTEIVNVMKDDPNVETLMSLVANTQYREGISFLKLKPKNDRLSSLAVIQELYPKLGKIPGVNVYLKNVPLIDLSIGTQSKGPYQFTLQSTEIDSLYRSAENLLAQLRANTIFQGITSDLERKTPELSVEVLRDQAYALGVNATDVENALLLAYSGSRVNRIQTPIDQFDVIVEVERMFQRDANALSQIYVRSTTTNQLVPLSAVAKWSDAVGSGSISHISQFPAVTLTFNVAPDVPLGEGIRQLRQLADETLEAGVLGNVKGAAQTFEESIQSTGYLFLFAILAIYLVLGILYESLIHPLTVLSTLPPAIFGGLLTLVLFGMSLSLYAYLGLILLIGIVKKNGIMMVDYALDFERLRGESPESAIVDACMVRLRPIMMTTVATVAGALPIVLGTGAGAASRRPLGLVIIGGLLFAQLITLFLTPVIYLYLDKWAKKLAWSEQQE